MTMVRNAAWLALAVALLALAPLGLRWLRGEPEPDFVPHHTVEGLRHLVIGGGTGPDALAGLGSDGARAMSPEAVCAALADPGIMPVLGPAEAPVRVVSFSDYRCPHCRVISPVLLDLAAAGAIRLVMQEWVVFGQPSALAARAALAAHRQGAYAALHERLMRTAFVFNTPFLMAVAGELGLDTERLASDMDDPILDAGIARAEALARGLGLRGTPSLVVGRTVVEGAIPAAMLRRLVELEARAGEAPCA